MAVIKHIAFHLYPVSDLARARGFYENTLGLKLSHNFADKWIEYNIGSSTLAVTTLTENLRSGAGGSIALEVDDLDAWVADLKKQKVPFTMEPMETPVCRMADIADPDGNLITLHQCKPAHH